MSPASRYEPALARKAIVAQTARRAAELRTAFDLDPSDWCCLGLGSAIGVGRHYDRVVVELPPALDVRTKNITSHLATLSGPGGVIVFV